MVIIGILLLVGSPLYRGYMKDARLTKRIAEIKVLENASSTYYMKHSAWLRLTDTPFTKEDLDTYAQEVYDKTGSEVYLDVEGNYYNIDYNKLYSYVKPPRDMHQYILQNPVGGIYYITELTEKGEEHVMVLNKQPLKSPGNGGSGNGGAGNGGVTIIVGGSNNNFDNSESGPFGIITDLTSNKSVKFNNLDPNLTDKNSSTYITSTTTVTYTWEGDLTNKGVFIDLYNSHSVVGSNIYVKDKEGNNISFKDSTGVTVQSQFILFNQRYSKNILIPSGAASIQIVPASGTTITVYDIYETTLK